MPIMKRFLSSVLLILVSSLIFLTGCSSGDSAITWSDVNQEFMELEKERATIMDSIATEKQKSLDPVADSTL
jgi:chorismate mutase